MTVEHDRAKTRPEPLQCIFRAASGFAQGGLYRHYNQCHSVVHCRYSAPPLIEKQLLDLAFAGVNNH